MKYATDSHLLIKFTRVGTKKETKTYPSYSTAKTALIKYLKKHPDCSAVVARILYNSESINDKWEYKR